MSPHSKGTGSGGRLRHSNFDVRTSSRSQILLQMLLSIKLQKFAATLHCSLQANGSRPNLLNVLQSCFGIVHLEIDALVAVFQIQFAAILIVCLADIDERLSKVG